MDDGISLKYPYVDDHAKLIFESGVDLVVDRFIYSLPPKEQKALDTEEVFDTAIREAYAKVDAVLEVARNQLVYREANAW